ncbi:MAG: tail fiber domain-containing protein [Gammaproteobacteria bacterium]|nr:tail fiber domain-containing protein [Gammaproteobacteria bacterium]
MNRYATYLICLLTMFPLIWANAANVPYIINYQGSVKTAGGMPYDGNGYFKFAIVDLAGTTSYWSNDSTSAVGSEPTASVEIAVSNGLFSVKLGDLSIVNMTTDLSGTVFDNKGTYIRTWFSDDDATFSQLSPDQQIVSTGHAIHAQSAENAGTLDGQDSSEFVNVAGDIMTGDLEIGSMTNSREFTVFDSDNCVNCNGIVISSGSFSDRTTLSNANSDFHIGSDGAIILNPSGNVGISEIFPAFKLEVGGGDINTTGGGYRDAGTCVAGTCASDKRLKRNIEPLSDSLNKITKLDPVTFEFNSPKFGPGKQVGLIAQDVEKVFPDWVVDSEEGHKSIRFGLQTQMHLIQAIKELKAQNDLLKERIETLENRE